MPQVIIYAVASFICAFALALAITRFLGLFVRVKGSSMKNTLRDITANINNRLNNQP